MGGGTEWCPGPAGHGQAQAGQAGQAGRYRVLCEPPAVPTLTQDGSGQQVIFVSGSQAGRIRAGKLVFLRAPGSALRFFPGITIAW